MNREIKYPERVGPELLNPFRLLRESRKSNIRPEILFAVAMEHLNRYEFADSVLPENSLVLDVACGIGYGANILKPREYIGFDLSPETIKTSRQTKAFAAADIRRLPIGDKTIGAIVSFETIEHIKPYERTRLGILTTVSDTLKEFRRVLKPGGLAIISTPLQEWSNPGQSVDAVPNNPHHFFELNEEEFKGVIDSTFNYVSYYFQGYPINTETPVYESASLANKLSSGISFLRKRGWRVTPEQSFDRSVLRPAYIICVAR